MDSARKLGSLIDELHKAQSCLAAMAVFVERVLRDGEDVRYISDGVELLISGQTDIIANTVDALSNEIDNVYTDRLKLRDLDQVAAMYGVGRDLVRNIVSSAVGVNIAADSAEARNSDTSSISQEAAADRERVWARCQREPDHAAA